MEVHCGNTSDGAWQFRRCGGCQGRQRNLRTYAERGGIVARTPQFVSAVGVNRPRSRRLRIAYPFRSAVPF